MTSATGSGIGQVNYTVAANSTGADRIGTMTVAGQTVTFTQSGSGCGADRDADQRHGALDRADQRAVGHDRHELLVERRQQRRLDHGDERRRAPESAR